MRMLSTSDVLDRHLKSLKSFMRVSSEWYSHSLS
jgi:hypothetical protein